ncbi:MAG: tetratricopeptide repeat protein [Phycisphaerales bacterium]|jgi:tetratricopeptide (TPR) repeat protein|nr:tetratricopeptide repeat protein [Phycisphaerales bacterium]
MGNESDINRASEGDDAALDQTLAAALSLESDESSVVMLAESAFDGLVDGALVQDGGISAPTLKMPAPGPDATGTDCFIHGVDQLRREDWAGGMESLQRAVDLDPRSSAYHAPRAMACLGYALLRLGRVEESVAVYRAAVEQSPDVPGIQSGFASALMAADLQEEAIAALRHAALTPLCGPPVFYNLGNLLARVGRAGEAEQAYKELLAVDPVNAAGLNNYAALLADQNRPAEAVSLLHRMQQAGVQTWRSRFNLGIVLGSLRRFDEALPHIRSLVADHPESVRARMLFARTLRSAGELLQAIEVLDEFLDWGDCKAAAQELLGLIHEELGNPIQAMVFWREAMETDPTYARVHAHVAARLLKDGELDGAADAIDRSIELNPARALSWVIRGRVELAGGRGGASITALERAVELDPGSTQARYWLGRAHLAEGSMVGALRQYERLDAANSPLARRLHKHLR